jgi:2-dehydropantoate 2-reductase
MKIAVVGTGAMGSVYAGLLAADGNEVWAIDTWTDHVAAMRETGLRVEGASGDRTVRVHATSDAHEAGVAELVIVATKAYDVEAAARAAAPLVGPDTVVLPIQNGLGSADRVAEILGDEPVAIGVAGGFGASIVAPGHVRHEGWELVRLGERQAPATERIREVADVWRHAGFRVETFDDTDRLVWEKLVCNVCFSGTCAVLELTISEVLDDPDAWRVASRCAVEADAVARALGVSVRYDDPVEYVRSFGSKIPDARPSMLLDVLANRRCEVDVINGSIPPLARELSLDAPFNEVITALVRAKEASWLKPARTSG